MTRHLSPSARAAREREMAEPNPALDAIAEIADEPARNDNVPYERTAYESPGALTAEHIAMLGRTDGWIDAERGEQEMRIAVRFWSTRLHLDNMRLFGVYSDAYQRAFNKRKEGGR